ncbi:MAG: hypothetical protein Q7J09_02630 [Methanocalculus sp.]|uniref:hypothetical protein n=1 Tax=Methanocalculus sp. TaxID=2004547 RepID=UPI00271C99F9|nr:hypothetical protein [Methanocalculus sp.]MDO9538885.1 hypothetical protein [Methanocalculus sp.]
MPKNANGRLISQGERGTTIIFENPYLLMVRLNPENTTILFFDLEAYVPEPLRRRPRIASLAANPHLPGVSLIGGVFSVCNPFHIGDPDLDHHWIWETDSERDLLISIYSIFREGWKSLAGKKRDEADLILAGIGISTFDIPFLYTRALIHSIAPAEDIYETFCCCRVLDLASAGIGYIRERHPIPHPITHNDLVKRFIGEEKKPGGSTVWDMMDHGDTNSIKSRTGEEVRQIIAIYQAMITENGSVPPRHDGTAESR